MNSKAIIPLSALVVAGIITFADLGKKGNPPTTRQWLGLAAVYFSLSLGSDVGFEPANGFAGLLMVAVLLSRGQEAFGYLGTKAGPVSKKQRGIKPSTVPPSQSEEPIVTEQRRLS